MLLTRILSSTSLNPSGAHLQQRMFENSRRFYSFESAEKMTYDELA